MKELPEVTQKGVVSLENIPEGLMQEGYMECSLGLQTAKDGRIWININGVAFLRFKPDGMGLGILRTQART